MAPVHADNEDCVDEAEDVVQCGGHTGPQQAEQVREARAARHGEGRVLLYELPTLLHLMVMMVMMMMMMIMITTQQQPEQ